MYVRTFKQIYLQQKKNLICIWPEQKHIEFVHGWSWFVSGKRNRTNLGLASNFPHQKKKACYQQISSGSFASNLNVIDLDACTSTSRKSIFLTFMTTLLLCFIFCSQSKYFILFLFLSLSLLASVELEQTSDYIKYI